MSEIAAESIRQIFTEARTFNGWLPQEVSDPTLRAVYDLMKWGPTSGNLGPIRILFIKKGPQKEKLLSALAEMNVEKVKAAPVTAVIASDEKFYEQAPRLFPHAPGFKDLFTADPVLAERTAFRNSSLQGGYLILAARALGLDCGPMSGFDNQKLDETLLAGTTWKSNFICNLGYGDKAKLFPRLPRLSFDEACQIV